MNEGGRAQYACLPETGAVAIKPDSLSWEQAVAIPFGANTALYFLRDLGKIRAGRIAEAFEYIEQRHKKGNVVITVTHP